MRFLAYLYWILQKQSYRESVEFFWKVYQETRNGNGFRQRLSGCLLHKLYYDQNANIALEAKIEEAPVLPHGLCGIFISKSAVIGRQCTIYQQVTIGSNQIPGSKGYGAPTIGNDVVIGAGARIIGKVHIGDHVRIGAGCVVSTDIPSNSTVVMEHPRILIRDHESDTV